ncbi:MAG: flagellar hook-length control protein FliK [Bdellovibrionaceae bacterium]|nr:flagellar hook-length control protein FliK [Pseudobdellovibrionaceae bacterium]
MLQNIVGPPVKGVADLVTSDKSKSLKEAKKAGSDSFGDVLGAKDKESPSPVSRDKSDKVEVQQEVGQDKEPRRGDPDKKAEKLKSTDNDRDNKKVKASGQRQQAILKFMDSFESEFGVPPTRIVEAMANLDNAQQAESPEETADQVIGQLDLDGQDTDQAKNMYLGLLAQLAQMQKQPAAMPKPENLETAAAAGGLSATAMAHERFVATQEKTQALNKSLDSMNEKFWMKGANAGQPMGAPQGDLADKMAQMSLQDKLGTPQGLQGLNVDEPSFARNMQAQLPPSAEAKQGMPPDSAETVASPVAALAALVAAARAAQSGNKAQTATTDDDSSDLESTTEPGGAVTGKTEIAPGAAKNIELTGQQQSQQQGQQKGFESFQQQQQQNGKEGFNGQDGMKNAKGEMLEKSKLTDKADFIKILGDGSLQPQGIAPLKQDFAVAGGAAVAANVTGVPVSPQENEANVRQIMNQAQYLIKKGGGEMKVQMSPEGMGNIHMKVMVENGKVNVQMSAETSEAKKALEEGLSGLKNSLAAHKLSMDHVKIDVVNSTNTENNTQSQMNQDQGGRDQTKQFWNKFSENFGSASQQRDNFSDIPSMKAYGRKRTDSPLEPIGSSSVSKYASSGKGSGLNLIA